MIDMIFWAFMLGCAVAVCLAPLCVEIDTDKEGH